MSFFDDASLAFLPSGAAGKDGKAYSIKPVPEYGSEEVTNGDFATDSDWIKGNGATISGGKANIIGDGSTYVSITQNSVFTTGKKYRVSVDVVINSGLGLKVQDGATNENIGFATSSGTYVFDFTAGANTSLVIGRRTGGTAFNSSVDNVSVKEVLVDGDFTFSRGSNLSATRISANGLIEKGRENLWLQSTDLGTSPNASSGAATITGGQSGYDGSSNAWELESLSDGFYRRLYQSTTQTGVITFSIYAKAANTSSLLIYNNQNGHRAWFDLSSGSLGALNGAIDSSIEDIGSGWYRCSISLLTSASSEFWICPTNGDNVASCDLGNSILLQDAQLEIGLAATDYIESGATTGKAGLLEDEPRFDYSGGVTCPSLLLEPSRTNLVTESEYYNGSYWGQTLVSITDNATNSPEGLQNASKLIPANGTGGNRSISKNYVSLTGLHTFSVFAKAAEYGYISLRMRNSPNSWAMFDLTNGLVHATETSAQMVSGSPKIEDYGNGWYRCSIVIDPSGSASAGQVYPSYSVGITGNETNNFNGDGVSGIYIYGSQFESGSYPTSYIPNHSGGTITRGDDICNGAGDVNTFNSTEGVLFAEISVDVNELAYKEVSVSDGTSSNRIEIRYIQNKIEFTSRIGGVSEVYGVFVPVSVLNFNKIALRYNGTDFKLYVNGSLVASDTSINTFPANTLNSAQFNSGAGASKFYGKAKQILYFPTALSDADCITLTTI